MKTDIDPMNAKLLERLRFIDFSLAYFGQIKRPFLMDYFGISQPQASHDLAWYRSLAPTNLVYDTTARAYVRASGFVRHFP